MRITVATGTRADWGLLSPLARALDKLPGFDVSILATNMHLHPAFGNTVDEIIADGVEVAARVPMLSADGKDTSPLETAAASARCLTGMADAFREIRPDIVLILGDRYEMLPVATAATIMRLPLAHIAGGEIFMPHLCAVQLEHLLGKTMQQLVGIGVVFPITHVSASYLF